MFKNGKELIVVCEKSSESRSTFAPGAGNAATAIEQETRTYSAGCPIYSDKCSNVDVRETERGQRYSAHR